MLYGDGSGLGLLDESFRLRAERPPESIQYESFTFVLTL